MSWEQLHAPEDWNMAQFVSCHQHHTPRDLAGIMPIYGSGNRCIDLSPGYSLWTSSDPLTTVWHPGSKPTKPQSGCRFQSCDWSPAYPSSSLQTVLLAQILDRRHSHLHPRDTKSILYLYSNFFTAIVCQQSYRSKHPVGDITFCPCIWYEATD